MRFASLLSCFAACATLSAPPVWAGRPTNLALAALGARARSWQPGAPEIPEHAASKANDGSFHTYWEVRPENLPADLGLEWPRPQTISSLIVRYCDGRMARGPAAARTQHWARLQQWSGSGWQDLDAQVVGQETSSVRYVIEPVTTTRIRLLFTEPPDPEGRRFPEKLGIFVCELEAYQDVPFQWVDSPGRLARVRLEGRRSGAQFYNEPPTGDNSFDLAGPLVIEPKQTRVFADTLAPTLIVPESSWAREACAVERPQPRVFRLRNGFLQLDVSTASVFGETLVTNRVTGESLATRESAGFVLRTSIGTVKPADFKVRSAETTGSGDQVARLRVELTSDKLDVAVHYELGRQDHFYHKWLTLSNNSGAPLQVLDVVVSSLNLPLPLDLMAGQELTYPITRLEKGGFFSCLETVYWEHRGDALAYLPGVTLDSGKTYDTEKAAVGVYRNRGEMVRGWDRGVREWVTEYHARISPPPHDWPGVYCEGWSAKVGLKELAERPEWLERTMELAGKLGIRYMDGYEPMHSAAAAPADLVKRFVALADRHGVGTGWWTDFGSDNPWGAGERLKPFSCLLSPEADAYLQKMVGFAKQYQLRALHWADFFAVYPCLRKDHGHLPGKYSIYAQGQRMLRFGQELRQAVPGIQLGADGGFTNPQFVRYEDDRAHGTFYGGYDGDAVPTVEPDIHLDRLYADFNRAYFYGSVAVFLRPWYRQLNSVNHYGQESNDHDRAGYRFSLLSALAMAGQVTFNGVPHNIPESEIEFTRRWLGWANQNKDYLKQGDKLFDRSIHQVDVRVGDAESLAGFAHIRGDRGYVFLLNPTPVEQIADLTLRLAASPSARFLVREVFPGGMTLRGPESGYYPQGGKLQVTVPGKQVRILWVAPAAGGAPGNFQPQDLRLAAARRYIGDWTVLSKTPEAVTLRARFEYPVSGRSYLAAAVPESAWAKQPWAHDKAYLVLLMKNEIEQLNYNWLPDRMLGLAATGGSVSPGLFALSVNGIPAALQEFKTGRLQSPGVTRCYFVGLGSETKPGGANEIHLTLPVEKGLLFSGAYLDLPDQMPAGE